MHNVHSAPSAPLSSHRSRPMDARLVLARINASQILPPALVRAGRSESIASIVAHAGAGLPLRVLSLVADAGLVLFAIDDLLDDSGVCVEEGSLRIEQYGAVARGELCPEVAFDPIARAIASLRGRIAATDPEGDMVDAWADAMVRMLAGMGAELRGASDSMGTSLEGYLASARDSIGVEMIAFTAWVAMGASATRALLPSLRRAERSFSTAVRLANDLRTCERERAEGRVNAVTLLGDAARPCLHDLCDDALAEARESLAATGIAHTAQGRFIDRFAGAIVAMYVTRDFEQAA